MEGCYWTRHFLWGFHRDRLRRYACDINREEVMSDTIRTACMYLLLLLGDFAFCIWLQNFVLKSILERRCTMVFSVVLSPGFRTLQQMQHI